MRLDEQRQQLLERARRLGRVAAAAALDCRRGVVGESLQPLEQRAARVAAEPRGGELAQPGHGHQSARRHEESVQAHIGPQGQDLYGDGSGAYEYGHGRDARGCRQGRQAGLAEPWDR